MDRLGGWAGRVAVGRPLTVIAWSAAAVVASFLAAQAVRQEFFSESDRNQLVIDLKLPEGSHLDATDRTSERLEEALAERPEVTGVTAFLGRSAPRFYYNISQVPWSPHFGQLVVDTTSTEVLEELAAFIRGFARDELPGTEVVVRKLEQGPPVAAPVEVRLYGASLPDLHQGAERVMALLRQTPGTTDVRHDLSLGTPALVFTIDDAAAARRGLARTDVASALFRTTRGMAVGWYRAGNDPVPVVLRSAAGEDFPLAELPSLDVTGAGGEPVPLAQLARLSPEWVPGAVRHRDRRRAVLVSSQLLPGFTYSQVVDALAPRLPEIALPAGITAELGGTAQSSGEANEALLRTLPAGLLLLLGILLAEFRSFRRVGLVLLTVPLAAVGVVPGLLLGDQPFGFMSLLGIMALAGVVVNNAIVLLEVVEARRRDGADVPTALADAVARRVRPIFLTTATTVLGLVPLAFSDSTLWPPLAWSMISGLTASTLLTLLVIPACYLLLFDPGRLRWRGAVRRRRAAPAAGVLLLLSLGVDAVAEVSPPLPVVTWQEALAGAGLRPRVAAETERAAALAHRAEAVRREARWPTVAGGAEVVERSLEPEIDTPVGRFRFGDSRLESASLTLIQPLLEPAARWFRAPAASTQAEAGELLAERAAEVAVAEAAEAYLDALAVEARITATRAFVASLETALAETETRVAHGRTLEVDALKVRLTLDSARQDLLRLGELSQVSALALGQAVGLATPARPAGPVPGEPSAPASFEAAWALALEQRTELRSLALEREAAVLSRKALTADALPRLEATVSGIYSTGNPFDDTEWVEGGVRLSWRPFAAGTRGPRRDALAQEEAALAATEAEARRSIALELRAALADWTVARSALAVATTGIAQATETLRVEQERHRAGRITTNDLLAAEAALRDQQTLRDLAALDLVRARVRYDLALGQAPAVGR
jgi:outer membrane protein TolC